MIDSSLDVLTGLTPAMLAPAVGAALLHFLWQGALIAAAYAALRWWLRAATPAVHVVLGQSAMLAFLAAPAVTLSRALTGSTEAASGPITTEAGAAASTSWSHTLDGNAVAAVLGSDGTVWLVSAWLLGVLVLSLRCLHEWWSIRSLCRLARPLPAPWPERLITLTSHMGLRRRVAVLESPAIDTPMLFGWLRPVVLLPAGLVLRLPSDHVVPILLHELAHVRRFDYLFNLAELAVRTLLYYHPAVHWLAGRLAQDRELACDDLVLRSGADRHHYAAALAELASERLALNTPVPRVAPAATAGLLLERIVRIVEWPGERSNRANVRPLWPVLVAAGAVLLIVLPTVRMDAIRTWQQSLAWPTATAFDIAAPTLRLAIETRDRLAKPLPMIVPSTLDAHTAEAGGIETSETRQAALLDPIASHIEATGSTVTATPTIDDRASTLSTAADPSNATRTDHGMASALSASAQPLPTATDPTRTDPTHTESAVRVISAVAPTYPRQARIDGIEGSVAFGFRIDAQGRPFDLRIESASPVGVFEREARRALLRWRFAVPTDHDDSQRLRHAFDFRLAGQAAAEAECVTPVGTRICR